MKINFFLAKQFSIRKYIVFTITLDQKRKMTVFKISTMVLRASAFSTFFEKLARIVVYFSGFTIISAKKIFLTESSDKFTNSKSLDTLREVLAY